VIVITDTSVVLNLCASRQERLLAEIFDHILAPPSVVQEFQRLVSVDPRFADLTFPLFVEVSSASQIAPELLLNQRLHQGEREALSLAAELGADAVLMDDEICNNLVENAIRPTKLGAKNPPSPRLRRTGWLFLGNEESGQKCAILYTIVENCRRLGTLWTRRSRVSALATSVRRILPSSAGNLNR
jgi:hypothetical protein